MILIGFPLSNMDQNAPWFYYVAYYVNVTLIFHNIVFFTKHKRPLIFFEVPCKYLPCKSGGITNSVFDTLPS